MRSKKPYDVFSKIRPKLREVYRFSPMRREAIKAVTFKSLVVGNAFKCPVCQSDWPIQMADVDHEPPLGSFTTFKELAGWANNLFYGPVQVLCKMCHKKKTAVQRKKAK